MSDQRETRNGRPTTSPNVIVFFTDQQRFDTTGVHGNPMGLTPNFDRMATEGTHFANTFSCQPVCAPARATLQTGRFATNTGVWRNGLSLPTETLTLAHHFKEAGYATGYIGKWHLASRDPVPRAEQGGYDYWLGANIPEFVSGAYDLRLYDNEGTEHQLPGYRVDAQTDAAIRFIDEHNGQPFFLCLSYLEPHHQNHLDAYPAPTGYEQAFCDPWLPPDLRAGGSSSRHLPGYYGMVKRLDEALGRLEDALRSLGLLENTVILYISDHGNHFKTRNDEYKRSCHDASVRVPCFATGPGFTGGGQVSELFSIVDIPPTLLGAAGITIPADMEGRSALPLLADPARRGVTSCGSEPVADWPDYVFIQISEAEVGRAIRTHRWKYSVSAPGLSGWENECSAQYTEAFLYDMKYDPYELENLVDLDSHTEVRVRLRRLLLEKIEAVEDRRPKIVEQEMRSGGQRRVTPDEVLE